MFAVALAMVGPTVNKTSASQLTIKPATPVQTQQSVSPAPQAQATPAPTPEPQAPAPEPAPAPVAEPQPVAPSSHEELMQLAGISQSDWPAVDYIVSHESGWCPFVHEGAGGGCPSSPDYAAGHAYGMCQSLPGDKMSSAGDDWLSNAVTQLKWCDSYATASYGGWWGAYSYWVAHRNW